MGDFKGHLVQAHQLWKAVVSKSNKRPQLKIANSIPDLIHFYFWHVFPHSRRFGRCFIVSPCHLRQHYQYWCESKGHATTKSYGVHCQFHSTPACR